MKTVAIFVMLAVCIGFTTVSQAQDAITQRTAGLSEFCGLKNDVRGPFGFQVDKSFFEKDTTAYSTSNDVYYTEFELRETKNTSLKLTNLSENSFAVVVSIHLPMNKFRNFIVPFNNPYEELTLNLDDALSALKVDNRKEHLYKISLTGGFAFSGEVHQDDAALQYLDMMVKILAYRPHMSTIQRFAVPPPLPKSSLLKWKIIRPASYMTLGSR